MKKKFSLFAVNPYVPESAIPPFLLERIVLVGKALHYKSITHLHKNGLVCLLSAAYPRVPESTIPIFFSI